MPAGIERPGAPAGNRPLRVLQLTDSHLFGDPERLLMGMNTRATLDAVLDFVQAEAGWPPDLILATGDLAQDASPGAYHHLRGRLEALGVPTFYLPGNHDDPDTMRANLPGRYVFDDVILRLGRWTIILLDTTVRGAVGGRLSAAELDRLETQLSNASEGSVLIAMHHPPANLGSAWIDAFGLDNPADFYAVIDRHPQVRAVCCGHVHQVFVEQRRGVSIVTSPSTCFQFKPGSASFALDEAMPGYRTLTLYPHGRIDTHVQRVPGKDLGLDASATGY